MSDTDTDEPDPGIPPAATNIINYTPDGAPWIAGYGCAVNPEFIAKLDVSRQGLTYSVIAWLGNTQAPQASYAVMSPPLDSEEEAFRQANKLLEVLAPTMHGKVYWPAGDT